MKERYGPLSITWGRMDDWLYFNFRILELRGMDQSNSTGQYQSATSRDKESPVKY